MRYFPNIEFRLPKQSQSFNSDLESILSNQDYFEIQENDYSTLYYNKTFSLIIINKPANLHKFLINYTENEKFWNIELTIPKSYKITLIVGFLIFISMSIYILTLSFTLKTLAFSFVFGSFPIAFGYIIMKRDINLWKNRINKIIKTPNKC